MYEEYSEDYQAMGINSVDDLMDALYEQYAAYMNYYGMNDDAGAYNSGSADEAGGDASASAEGEGVR